MREVILPTGNTTPGGTPQPPAITQGRDIIARLDRIIELLERIDPSTF